MCGIAGAICHHADDAREAVVRMCEAMIPRGPDDGGLELLSGGRLPVALGSRRLAIIAPGPSGHQPMRDDATGTTLVFNGMIYNFRELRARLRASGARFVSECDTEVVLRAYQCWGVDFVRELQGMFALAIWDENRAQLLLARDRLGIKPLYYTQTADEFLFASQVKTLLRSGRVPVKLSRPGIASYLAFGAVSEPATAVEGVYALEPGHVATLTSGVLETRRYWALPDPAESLSREVAVEELRDLVLSAVKSHLISDAPLGVFLSGGLDSSIVAAVAARESSQVTTISVDFEEAAFSEGRHITMMTDRLMGQHIRVPVRSQDLVEMQPAGFTAMDQPSIDGLNTYLVSRAASSSGLKVALSGLGADELFDGYGHVARARKLEAALRLPTPLIKTARLMPVRFTPGGDKLRDWLSGRANRGKSYEFIRRMLTDRDVRRLLTEPLDYDSTSTPAPLQLTLPLGRQVFDREVRHYLGFMLLRDTDAMSMANSLEVRVPFLDDALVSWAARLPAQLRDGGRKDLLIAAMGDMVPREIRDRPKRGFMLPFEPWLRGPLLTEAEQEFAEPAPLLAGIIDPDVMYGIWRDYVDTGARWVRAWSLYSLNKWSRLVTSGQ